MEFKARSFNQLYGKLIREFKQGIDSKRLHEVSPRENPTWEIPELVTWTVAEPWDC